MRILIGPSLFELRGKRGDITLSIDCGPLLGHLLERPVGVKIAVSDDAAEALRDGLNEALGARSRWWSLIPFRRRDIAARSHADELNRRDVELIHHERALRRAAEARVAELEKARQPDRSPPVEGAAA